MYKIKEIYLCVPTKVIINCSYMLEFNSDEAMEYSEKPYLGTMQK
jgi:hypothetical protein